MNANSRSKDDVDVAIEKYKDHPSLSFKDIRESDIQKWELSEIFLRIYLRIPPIFVTPYFKIYGTMRY